MNTKSTVRFSLIILSLMGCQALADGRWGIAVVTDDARVACELKKPLSISTQGEGVEDVWVGFYSLSKESQVPGHVLPPKEILLIVKTSPDWGESDAYEKPESATVLGNTLREYSLRGVRDSAYFFAAGKTASELLQRAEVGAGSEIHFEMKDGSLRVLTVDTKGDAEFPYYGKMFRSCHEVNKV